MKHTDLKLAIHALLDGSISEEDLVTLEHELAHNEDARKLYIECSEIHSLLEEKTTSSPTVKNVVPIERIIRRQKLRNMRVAAFAAAALVIIGLVVMQFFMVDERPPTLTFATAPGTQFKLSHSKANSTSAGMTMEKGSRLQLSQGTVELTFTSGVRSIIMAPADITLHQDDTLFMNQGTAWFQVPQKAIGFTVKTKELHVIDLGTEFGVISKPDVHDEVHVFKGKVKATAQGLRKASVDLIAGQARRTDPVGRLIKCPSAISQFTTSLPHSLPHLHWSFDGDTPFSPTVYLLAPHKPVTTQPVQSDSRPATQRLVQGKNGNALFFNGAGDHLKTNWPGILGNTPRTVACWIKIHPNNPKGWGPIVEWGDTNNNGYWRLRLVNKQNKAVLRLGLGRNWYDGSINLADGQWHHIVCVDRGQISQPNQPSIKFYVDGVEEPATRQVKPLAEQPRNTQFNLPLILGRHHALQAADVSLHGTIDDLFIFQGELPVEQIHQLRTSKGSH